MIFSPSYIQYIEAEKDGGRKMKIVKSTVGGSGGGGCRGDSMEQTA